MNCFCPHTVEWHAVLPSLSVVQERPGLSPLKEMERMGSASCADVQIPSCSVAAFSILGGSPAKIVNPKDAPCFYGSLGNRDLYACCSLYAPFMRVSEVAPVWLANAQCLGPPVVQ